MKVLLIAFLLPSLMAKAQLAYNFLNPKYSIPQTTFSDKQNTLSASRRKLYQRNTGMILGLQRGKYTSLELGGEAHWRKISLLKPRIAGVTALMQYNFYDNILGYTAGLWMKRGRINLTYGANISYFTNFNGAGLVVVGPSVGFRFFGFHVVNGYNFFSNQKPANSEIPVTAFPVNTLYISLRYYFPVSNKFTWDRKTMQRKKARQKEYARKQKLRNKYRDKKQSNTKALWNIFRSKKNNS